MEQYNFASTNLQLDISYTNSALYYPNNGYVHSVQLQFTLSYVSLSVCNAYLEEISSRNNGIGFELVRDAFVWMYFKVNRRILSKYMLS